MKQVKQLKSKVNTFPREPKGNPKETPLRYPGFFLTNKKTPVCNKKKPD